MKHKRLLGYGAIGLTLTAIGVAFLRPFNLGNLLFLARADLGNLSVTFNSSGAQSHTGNAYYRSATTSLGNTFYLRNQTNVNPQPTYVATMCGNSEKGSVENEILFTTTNNGTTLFEFKNIKSISAVSNSSNTRTLTVFRSSDGINWSDAGSLAITSSGGTNTDVSGAKYIKLTYPSAFFTVYITSFTINYSCSDEPEPEKELSSISVSGQTTEFTVGDTFSFGGTVTAHYSDSTSADVTGSATFSGYDMDESGEQTVTVTYTEDGVTKTTTYDIEVKKAGEDVSGTYTGTYKNSSGAVYALTLALNNNGAGTFTAINTSTESQTNTTSFNWTYESSVLTLTKISQTVTIGIRIYTSSGTYSTTNSTGVFSGTVLTITMYTSQYSSSAISITLSK